MSGAESEGGEQPTSPGEGASRRDSIKANVKRRLSSSSRKSQKSGGVDTTHDAMGSKWPKGMWDNTESRFKLLVKNLLFQYEHNIVYVNFWWILLKNIHCISRLLANDNGNRNVRCDACQLHKTVRG